MTKQLATVPLIESDVQARDEQTLRQKLAQQSVLGSDRTNVERLGSEAGDVRLQGLLRPPLTSDKAELLATELAELSRSAKPQVPLFRRDDDRSPGRFGRAGWYSVESATVKPAHPADQAVYQLDVSLSKAGTRGNSFRAIRTNPQTFDTPFDKDSSTSPGERVIIPSAAAKVQFFNEQTGETKPAAAVSSPSDSAFPISLSAYDFSDSPFAIGDTTLIYDVPYQFDVAGARVYDSRSKFKRLDEDDIRQWPVVHTTDHVFDGEVIIQNHAFRMRLEGEPETSFNVFEYDESNDAWGRINTSQLDSWELFDIDLVEINQHRVSGRLIWYNFDTEETYPLFFKLALNDSGGIFFARVPGADPIPQDIEFLVDIVATDDDTDIQATRTLIPKSEVRT